jgi:hypothetical protein
VTFYDGAVSIGTATISGTTATLITSSLSVGSHSITAGWLGNDSYGAVVSSSIAQVINQAVPSISWANPAAIPYGTALSAAQLDASSTVAGTFTYSPATGSILTAGSHVITATFNPIDATDYAAATATVTLTVNQAAPAITWNASAPVTYGTALSTVQLDASSTVPGTFAYSPAAGTVLKAGAQTLSVTFTPTDSTDYATATATVPLTVNQATPTITWPAPAPITSGTALSATQLDATASVAGTFTYSPAAGTVLAAGGHTLTATFTPTDTTDYSTATAVTALTVNSTTQTTPAITWATPAPIAYRTALSAAQLDATASVAGTFSYSPAAGTVLKAGAQTLVVTFTPTDTTDYTTATASVTLTVTQATPAISWATPAAITYGTALSTTQLDASTTVAGTFSYSPASGTVLKAGAQTLSVTFTPTDTTDYTTATATVPLTVNQATPSITWATPAAITSGTALSSTQLDASSTVAGTFVYSPTAGTILAAGSQTLSVTFTPTDTTDYTTATGSVTLTVNQGVSTLTINAASIGFGNVGLNQPATQTLILTSSGTGSVTVNSAVVAGAGFTLSGPTLPDTLGSGQTATLDVQYDPTALGASSGTLTITSTSSTNGTAVITLAGTGVATAYAVDLSWDAPASSSDPVAGYNVYKTPSGSSNYQLVGSTVGVGATSLTDSNVQDGQVYDYIVESVDASGVTSVPTSPLAVTIP